MQSELKSYLKHTTKQQKTQQKIYLKFNTTPNLLSAGFATNRPIVSIFTYQM